MIGKKILATLVVLAMIVSTLVVIKQFDIDFVEDVSATTIGVDDWQGSSATGSPNVLNMTTETIKVGATVNVHFNGSVITSDSYVFYPQYHTAYNDVWEVWTNWSLYNPSNPKTLIATANEPTQSITFDRAGLWLVAATDAINLDDGTNMSSMQIYDDGWEDIIGWFWVNSTDYTVELNNDDLYYDRNDSLTITVKDEDGEVLSDDVYVDIWKISGDDYDIIWHEKLNEGTWALDGEDIYDLTHAKGGGIYSVTAYKDVYPGDDNNEALRIYGTSGAVSTQGQRGYNSTFGNTTIWSNRFIISGTTSLILDYNENRVDTGTWNYTTYKWDTCGPFNPPEYWADYTNFTVNAGVPSATVTNGTQFWNDNRTDNEVKITIKDYDDNNLTASSFTIKLYNKSQRPTRESATPISSDHFNFSYDGADIKIQPFHKGTIWNTWGQNESSGYEWAPKGRIYVVVYADLVGNASEEWNTTAQFELVTAKPRFKWVDDDGEYFTDDDDDGVIPKIPDEDNIPLQIQFKLQSGDYKYWGNFNDDGDADCSSEREAAENITISGDSLFTGTVDSLPGYDGAWFASNVWRIPIIPLMDEDGGEITITATVFNTTVSATLTIGGTSYYRNGSVVSVTPNKFKIDEVDRTLSIQVEDATGSAIKYAHVWLYYIDESIFGDGLGAAGGILTDHFIDHITSDSSGVYTMEFNTTQQTTNQTEAGLAAKKAPRNLTLYVDSSAGYGYAKILMTPLNDLEVEISRDTFIAGYLYDEFFINITKVGNSTETPHEDDADEFFIKVLDEDGDDVTATIFDDSSSPYDATDFTDDDDYIFSFTDVIAREPGTYTVYAYNNTHDSIGYNATFTVEQVMVTSDITPLIWNYDENISIQLTMTYNGQPISGSLIIDNVTDIGDYNQTWKNSSYNLETGSDDGGVTNSSTEILEDEITNGIVTIHDVTANFLPDNTALENITFFFKPLNADDAEGVYARAYGKLPIQVPTATPDKSYVSVGRTTSVNIHVTGRGTSLEDVYVRLHGAGVDTNTTSDDDGIATFAIYPTATGDINIDVGEEGRTIKTKLVSTGWTLSVALDKTQVDEGGMFTVTVTRAGTTTKVNGARVTFNGETKTAGTDGTTTFTAPSVSSDRTFTITVSADGYAPDPNPITITVINVPKIYLSGPDTDPTVGSTFTITAGADNGNNAGISVTFNGVTKVTAGSGEVTFTAPDEAGDYQATATKEGYSAATPLTVTVVSGAPGFELLTLIAAIGVAFILLRRRRH